MQTKRNSWDYKDIYRMHQENKVKCKAAKEHCIMEEVQE